MLKITVDIELKGGIEYEVETEKKVFTKLSSMWAYLDELMAEVIAVDEMAINEEAYTDSYINITICNNFMDVLYEECTSLDEYMADEGEALAKNINDFINDLKADLKDIEN